MHSEPLISVVIPVYNVEKYLGQCLESICKQTYHNLEIICVDDGSPDHSIDILNDFASRDSRVRVIRQQNQGLAAARNSGLEVARGEWITFIDSDDWLETNAYEKCVAHISDDIDLVVFGIQIDWDVPDHSAERQRIVRGMHEFHRVKFEGKTEFSSSVALVTDASVCNKLFRFSVIKEHAITFPVGRWYEDTSFILQFFLLGRCGYFMKEFRPYHYIQRGGSIMAQTRQLSSRSIDFLEVIRDIYSIIRERGTEKKDRGFMARLANDLIRSATVNATEERLAEVRSTAREIVTEMGIAHMGEYDYIYRVAPSPIGFLRRFFHSWKGKKEKFGIWGFKPLAIHHLGDVDVWRFLDLKLFSVKRD